MYERYNGTLDAFNNAMMAKRASDWAQKELDRFKDYMAEAKSESSGAEMALQAGGELLAYPLKDMDREVWKGFQEKFLNIQG